MTMTLSGSGTIAGLVAGGLPDATIVNDDVVSVDGAKLTGNVPAAQITTALNATGSAPVYACRAWVNFNGTGTVAIRDSGNVSSITDAGTGNYTVNFSTAMPDANYSAVATQAPSPSSGICVAVNGTGVNSPNTASTTSFSVTTYNPYNGGAFDSTYINVAVFR